MNGEQTHQRMLDKDPKPTQEDMLQFILGEKAIEAWAQLLQYINTNYDMLQEIIFYGEKYGWLIRYRKGGRTIVSLFPEKQSFSVLIVYGKNEIEKFLKQKSEFLPTIVEVFNSTKKLHDGKWLWIRVTTSDYFDDLKKLIAIKRKPKR